MDFEFEINNLKVQLDALRGEFDIFKAGNPVSEPVYDKAFYKITFPNIGIDGFQGVYLVNKSAAKEFGIFLEDGTNVTSEESSKFEYEVIDKSPIVLGSNDDRILDWMDKMIEREIRVEDIIKP